MFGWLKKWFRRESEPVKPVAPEQVIDPDPVKRFIVSEAINSGQMIMGTIDDDGNMVVNYSGGHKRHGKVDESGEFHETEAR